MRNSPADTKVREARGEEVMQVLEQRFPCSLGKRSWMNRLSYTATHGVVTLEQGYPKGLQPMEGPILEQEKNVRRKEQEGRGGVMD